MGSRFKLAKKLGETQSISDTFDLINKSLQAVVSFHKTC